MPITDVSELRPIPKSSFIEGKVPRCRHGVYDPQGDGSGCRRCQPEIATKVYAAGALATCPDKIRGEFGSWIHPHTLPCLYCIGESQRLKLFQSFPEAELYPNFWPDDPDDYQSETDTPVNPIAYERGSVERWAVGRWPSLDEMFPEDDAEKPK